MNDALLLQRDIESMNNGGWTLGKLTVNGTKPFTIMSLEDEGRAVKVKGETRIPAGRYEIDYNVTGGMNADYKKDYPDIHKGMIQILNVKNAVMEFNNVYIHVGNYEKDTMGCPLVGMSRNVANGTIGESRIAYRQFYKAISLILDTNKKAGVKTYITIIDPPKTVKQEPVKAAVKPAVKVVTTTKKK